MKNTGTSEASFTKRIQLMEEKSSGIEDTIDKINISVKENIKYKKLLAQNSQEI